MSRSLTDVADLLLAEGVDLRARRIFFQGPLERNEHYSFAPVETAIRALTFLDRSDGAIELWVTTPGGQVSEMFALYDVIRTRRNRVVTVGTGEIASAGCLVLAAGDTRKVTENSWFMSHAPTGGVDPLDSLPSTRQRLAATERMNERWATLMAKHTVKSRKYWREVHEGRTRELWLDAAQMLEYGIADEVLPDVDPVDDP